MEHHSTEIDRSYVHRDLIKKGYIVRDAATLGMDFAIYVDAVEKVHSSLLVFVASNGCMLGAKDFIFFNRMAANVNKDAVIAHVNGDDINYMAIKRVKFQNDANREDEI